MRFSNPGNAKQKLFFPRPHQRGVKMYYYIETKKADLSSIEKLSKN